MSEETPNVTIISGSALEQLKESVSAQAFGTPRSVGLKAGICISCKRAVKRADGAWQPDMFHTEAGKREWSISGLCESCFDSLFEEGDEQ